MKSLLPPLEHCPASCSSVKPPERQNKFPAKRCENDATRDLRCGSVYRAGPVTGYNNGRVARTDFRRKEERDHKDCQLPYRAFKRNLTASYFAPFILTLSVLAGVVLWRFQNQASITGWVEHSDQVILRVKDVELELREMQSGLHGYLLTSDKRYLTELGDARDALGKNIAIISALVADNPGQEQRVLEISDLKGTWNEAIESLISQRAGGQPNKEALAEAQTRAQAVFNSLENLIAAEHQLRVQRAARQTTEYYVVFVLVPVLTAVVMVFLSYWGWRQIQLATEQFHEALDTAERARDAAEKASASGREGESSQRQFHRDGIPRTEDAAKFDHALVRCATS